MKTKKLKDFTIGEIKEICDNTALCHECKFLNACLSIVTTTPDWWIKENLEKEVFINGTN